MKLIKFAAAAFLLLVGIGARAGEFSAGYTIKYGDFHGDGGRDLFIQAPAAKIVPILLDDMIIPVKVCCTKDLFLVNDGAGSFTMVSDPSPAQRALAAAWTIAEEMIANPRDIDLDGIIDLEIVGIRTLIGNGNDVILYGNASTQTPTMVTLNPRIRRYWAQVSGWLADNNFFHANAPLVMTPGSTPASPRWFASVLNPSNTTLINMFLSQCRSRFPGSQCGTTPVFPPGEPCVRNVAIYDSQGRYIGNTNTNLCDYPLHIVYYEGGNVTYQRDYSVFEPDALETADILDRLNDGCHAMPTNDQERLESIIESQIIRNIGNVLASDTANSWPHEPFPEDANYVQQDITFHHYDVKTRICKLSEANCTLPIVKDTVHRYFTYPAYQLRPTMTPIDGVTVHTAYITAPGATSFPSAYIWAAGPIIQQWIQSSVWVGGTRNVTQNGHVVYPGTISRHISVKGDGIEVFTHGMGHNRAFCKLAVENRAMQAFIGRGNDINGPLAFGQLDHEMRKYWRQRYRPGGNNKIEPVGPPDEINPALE
ncbi:MAG TPA: hypothetical protein VFU13_02810 [Steroidobacteraceae bacterium]|nr:hypothetical protein [Steroidobacteraceae bacterium]